jgi:signal transduction histidine kinase
MIRWRKLITEEYNPDELKESQLSRFIFIGIIACITYIVIYALAHLWILAFMLLFTVGAIILLWFLLYQKKIPIRWACHLFLFFTFCLGVMPGVLITGGFVASGMYWLALPPMIVQMVLSNKRDALIWLFIDIIILLATAYLYYIRYPILYIYDYPDDYLLDTFMTYLGLFLITTVLAISFIEKELVARNFLQTKSQLLETTNQVAQIGAWELDVESNLLSWSKLTSEIFELPPELNGRLSLNSPLFHSPESNNLIEDKLNKAIRLGEIFDVQVDIRSRQGVFKWIRVLGIPLVENDRCIKVFGLVHDITELRSYSNFLKQSKELADNALKSKSDFIAHVTHEIRSPLNAIIGFSNMLAYSNLNEEFKNYIASIRVASRQLLYLVNAVLDMSKIEAGKFTLQPVSTSTGTLSDKLYQLMLEEVTNPNVILDFYMDNNIPQKISIDIVRFEQVCYQLVRNAAKYTQKGKISFRLELVKKELDMVTLRCSISDTGIGIDEENQKIILNFLDQTIVTEQVDVGVGIGLTISKSIIDKMNSELKFTSTPGSGSVFYFEYTIPILEEEEVDKNTQDVPEAILIVEDDEFNRMFLELTLKSMYPTAQLWVAKSGGHAVDIFKRNPINVIITDWNMPEMNGKELIYYIRYVLKDEKVAVITLSGEQIESAQSEDLKINACLLKPLSVKELGEEIRKALR